MEGRRLLAALAAALTIVPAATSAFFQYPPPGDVHERLVEGHTIFALIEKEFCVYGDDNETQLGECPYLYETGDSSYSWDVRANVTVQRFGTAVAVLVRDRVKEYNPPPVGPCATNRDLVASLLWENPGVLWFNDQFLVGDDLDLVEAEVDANVDVCRRDVSVRTVFHGEWRYPCGGWVYATQAGNPDPRPLLPQLGYVESYLVTDPNDYVWTIDRYAGFAAPLPLASTYDAAWDFDMDEDDGPGTAYDEDDEWADNTTRDGDLRVLVGPSPDTNATLAYHLAAYDVWTVPVLGVDGPDGGGSCDPYADAAGTATATRTYGDGCDFRPDCAETARLYNAVLFFFFEDVARVPAAPKVHGDGAPHDGDTSGCQVATEWECPPEGDDAEGNSHPFNPSNSSGPLHLHPTAAVDLYFGNEPPPAPNASDRRWAVRDTVGANATRHVHGAEAVDDRLRFDACADQDEEQETTRYDWNGTTLNQTYYDYQRRETYRWGEGEYGTDGNDTSDCMW